MKGDACIVHLDTDAYDHLHKLIGITADDVGLIWTRSLRFTVRTAR